MSTTTTMRGRRRRRRGTRREKAIARRRARHAGPRPSAARSRRPRRGQTACRRPAVIDELVLPGEKRAPPLDRPDGRRAHAPLAARQGGGEGGGARDRGEWARRRGLDRPRPNSPRPRTTVPRPRRAAESVGRPSRSAARPLWRDEPPPRRRRPRPFGATSASGCRSHAAHDEPDAAPRVADESPGAASSPPTASPLRAAATSNDIPDHPFLRNYRIPPRGRALRWGGSRRR